MQTVWFLDQILFELPFVRGYQINVKRLEFFERVIVKYRRTNLVKMKECEEYFGTIYRK